MEGLMIYRSPFPDVEIPDLALAPFLLRHAGRLADKPALIDAASGQGYTYAQLALAVRQMAASLTRRGFRPGDVFALYASGSPDYVVAMLGVWSLGGVITTANPLMTSTELHQQLLDAHATLLLTTPEMLEKARAAAAETPVQELLCVGQAPGATPFASLLTGDGAVAPVAVQPGDLAAIPYSSGTTGLPKGVELTHRNIVANACQFQAVAQVTERDVIINPMPFFHAAGWVILFHMGLANGCTVVTMPRFDLEPFLRACQQYQVTSTLLVPPCLVALAKQPVVDQYDLSALRVIFTGAAPVPEPVARACIARIGCHIQQVYGLTETSPVTHTNPQATAESKLAAVGVAVPNTEVKIADLATGADLGPHEDGEICVRGPQVMRGYYNRPDATAASIDPDGWFHTGDIGHVDEDGYFSIVDRLKELIKYNAYQVAPAELEAALLSHPAVADAAVIPSPDEQHGEVPKAFVVLKGDATADELMAYVAGRVAPYKKVRRLEFIDAIPKTASGKILRRLLVARERERAQAVDST
jgi:acyl-CoA synthetase (AMP-forming)/AMP-acid ligase II